MDRNNASRRLWTVAGKLAACAASLLLACALPARADQLQQHNDLVNKFVNEMHADPLVADCAAHGDFVASTSSALDHVEFPASSLDSTHATITPWNDSFDEGKQRVKVDTIVSVDGVGIPQNADNPPLDLKFRCGYVGNQMLAFSWNDPVPPARARTTGSSSAHGNAHGRSKHAAGGKGSSKKKSAGKGSKKSASGKTATKSKSSSQSAQ